MQQYLPFVYKSKGIQVKNPTCVQMGFLDYSFITSPGLSAKNLYFFV